MWQCSHTHRERARVTRRGRYFLYNRTDIYAAAFHAFITFAIACQFKLCLLSVSELCDADSRCIMWNLANFPAHIRHEWTWAFTCTRRHTLTTNIDILFRSEFKCVVIQIFFLLSMVLCPVHCDCDCEFVYFGEFEIWILCICVSHDIFFFRYRHARIQ